MKLARSVSHARSHPADRHVILLTIGEGATSERKSLRRRIAISSRAPSSEGTRTVSLHSARTLLMFDRGTHNTPKLISTIVSPPAALRLRVNRIMLAQTYGTTATSPREAAFANPPRPRVRCSFRREQLRISSALCFGNPSSQSTAASLGGSSDDGVYEYWPATRDGGTEKDWIVSRIDAF